MGTKLSKRSISELMAWWGRKGGSRATEKQRHAALENLKKTPNYRKHVAERVAAVTAAMGRRADTPTKENQ
jgi:predicted phosphoadenosine phosphosulfate sulfurtransferase